MMIDLRSCTNLELNSKNIYGKKEIKNVSSRVAEKNGRHFMYRTAFQ
jgi:hypothetical protein